LPVKSVTATGSSGCVGGSTTVSTGAGVELGAEAEPPPPPQEVSVKGTRQIAISDLKIEESLIKFTRFFIVFRYLYSSFEEIRSSSVR